MFRNQGGASLQRIEVLSSHHQEALRQEVQCMAGKFVVDTWSEIDGWKTVSVCFYTSQTGATYIPGPTQTVQYEGQLPWNYPCNFVTKHTTPEERSRVCRMIHDRMKDFETYIDYTEHVGSPLRARWRLKSEYWKYLPHTPLAILNPILTTPGLKREKQLNHLPNFLQHKWVCSSCGAWGIAILGLPKTCRLCHSSNISREGHA